MTVFIYSATNREGKVARGEREAENQKALGVSLRAEGLLVLDAEEKGSGAGLLPASLNMREWIGRLRPVSVVEKMFFTRNLGVMITAGLALPRALDALGAQASSKRFKKIIGQVNDSVIKGRSFAESLRPHEAVFSALFINMIEVGEISGKLTLILKLLANQMKKDHALRKRVRGAMMYPAIILASLVGIGTLMMVYVVPTLSATIKELGATLPLSTRLIIGTSEFITGYGLWIAIAAIACVVLIWKLMKTSRGKKIFDRWVLKMPLFGVLIQKYNTARFCRTLAYLLTAGVPIVRALEITARVLSNTLFQDVAVEAGKEIQKGKELHAILALHPQVFQSLVNQMVAVGEETGKLADMLLRVALFFEGEVTDTTKNLSTIIEPVLMIIIGAVVGLFAVSMLQPIYSSLGNI